MATINSSKIINDVSSTLKKYYSTKPSISSKTVNLFVSNDSLKPQISEKGEEEKPKVRSRYRSPQQGNDKQLPVKSKGNPVLPTVKGKDQFNDELAKKDAATNIPYKSKSLKYLQGIYDSVRKEDKKEDEDNTVKKAKINIMGMLVAGISGFVGWISSGFMKLKGALSFLSPVLSKLKNSKAVKFISNYMDDIARQIKGTKLFQSLSKIIGKVKFVGGKIGGIFDDLLKPLKTVFKFFGKMGKSSKVLSKAGSLAKFGGMFGKFLQPIMKKIPIIGALFTFAGAVSRFQKGDVVGGIIDIASGVSGFIPGFGIPISLGLALLNMGRDKYKKDKIKTGGKPNIFDKFVKYVKPIIMNLPPMFQVMKIGSAVGKFKSGDVKGGLLDLGSAVVGMIPGIGQAYSLAVGFLGSSRGKAVTKKVKSVAFNIFDKFISYVKPVVNNLPPMFQIRKIGEGIEKIKKGDVKGGIIDLGSAVVGMIPGIGQAYSLAVGFLGSKKGKATTKKVKAVAFNIFEKFKNFMTPIINNLPPMFQIRKIGEGIEKFKSGDIKGGLLDLGSAVVGMVPSIGPLFSLAAGFLGSKKGNELTKRIKSSSIGNFMSKFFYKLKDSIGGIGQAVIDFAMKPINAIKEFFSKKAPEDKVEKDDGLFKDITDKAKKFFTDLITSLNFSQIFEDIKNYATETWDGVKQFFDSDYRDLESQTEVDKGWFNRNVEKDKEGKLTIESRKKLINKEQDDVTALKKQLINLSERLEQAKKTGNKNNEEEATKAIDRFSKMLGDILREREKSTDVADNLSAEIYREAFKDNSILNAKLYAP